MAELIHLKYEKQGYLLILTLNRPEKCKQCTALVNNDRN
jgi:hypothetical protein